MKDKLFWGDLHSHCAVSYGYGTIEQAFENARLQLDFATVTGHATWHDMPTDRARFGRIIDFHKEGFERLAENWPAVQAEVERQNVDGEFAAILSYEWHSIAYGDYNVYYPGSVGDIVEADSIDELERRLGGRVAFFFPHHIGYGPGNRGVNWEHFDEKRSPVVEVFSGHGGSERDGGSFPMYHTMGARTHFGTVAHGLSLGKRFGFVAGTDHHGGFPGHYGEGRTAVYAAELTRQSILEAIAKRHCYAVTGDKIGVEFGLNDAVMGDEIVALGRRQLSFRVRGADVIDRLEVIKNNRVVHRAFPTLPTLGAEFTAKVRVEWGWGDKDEYVDWDGKLRVIGGRIASVEPCFNGDPVLAPSAAGVEVADRTLHGFKQESDDLLHWTSRTKGNPQPMVRGTSALIVEIAGGMATGLAFEVNGRSFSYSLAQLLEGSRAETMRGWRSETVLVHRAVPEGSFTLAGGFEDSHDGADTDFYYLRVVQENGQWAWSSPIWVDFSR